ncbi:HPF/RaiA family ribosome-associated protein [Spirosoma rhododendri]|uniref:HPF/RaiA family ribosome-associated protein n=1 Tax=Spirosoma rhododendri TaxID=2728024 RepID=A0A7L5DP25_9BACT|nr:HPF/RaiA family ribosome-associated protein [Spirosoma rhododendri]QJD78953.1 HPF/RaiA family ribosome-associated protein [Spirosoma rhododendri]
MRLKMHAVRFTADQSLFDFIQAKLNKLDTFHDHIVSGEVFLKLEGADSNKVKEKIIEVRLMLPGKEIFVKENDKSFEAATDRVLEVLKDKLVRCKQKRNDFSSQAIVDEKARMQADETVDVDDL